MDAAVVVAGGGITGLAAAHRLRARLGPGAVALVDQAPRLGGKILTERRDGFVLEGGPDCFLASKPAGMALCGELGLTGRLIGTDPRHRRSYVKRNGRLHPLPDGLTGLVPSRITPLLTTGILSLPGRLRAGLELLVPRRRGDEDESVGVFVRRRFGREAWDWLIEPLLSGIYAGDGDRMSLGSTFPQLRALERARGSLLRPMLTARFTGPRNGGGRTGFVTLPGGLGELVDTLADRLHGTRVLTGRAVVEVRREEPGWMVMLDHGLAIRAGAVLLAAPAPAAARVLRRLDPGLSDVLDRIPHVSTATVSLAFRRQDLRRALPGYGYLSPRAEGGPIVAGTFTSNKFPARSPEDAVLVRCFVGRDGAEEAVVQDDRTLESLVRAELRQVAGLTAEPLFATVTRWPRGLPQYILGHGDRLREIEARLAGWPGLRLAGASYGGVGIPDCIASGWDAAEAIAARVAVA